MVRISGPGATRALEALAGRLPPPRVATMANLHWQGDRLDTALILRFPAPHSATGEDVAELHLHGGRSVVAATLAALAQLPGFRAAEAGEFTRRAFENGRIDLAEAEGLADLLEAETETQRRNALLLAGGALSRQVENWRVAILGFAAQIESALDFSDEDDVSPLPDDFDLKLGALSCDISMWLRRPSAERLKEGIRIVIAGPPNAGKSSLLNALAGREAAITAPVPGTTRDVIEVPLALGGRPILLVDTAGLRESGDEVEAIGIVRAQTAAETADLVLWLGDPALAPPRSILVHTKSDLQRPTKKAEALVSVVTGEGLDQLSRILIQRSEALLPAAGEVAVHARHRQLLEAVHQALEEGRATADLLIRAEAFRAAARSLDAITGKAGVEDMLDSLFGRFCIGK